jgi:hypothetical protein
MPSRSATSRVDMTSLRVSGLAAGVAIHLCHRPSTIPQSGRSDGRDRHCIEHSPNPVLGADGKNHLVYEITIVNQTPGEVTIQSVQARAGGRPIGARLKGQSLADLLRINSGGGPAISGGGSALLFMDVQ